MEYIKNLITLICTLIATTVTFLNFILSIYDRYKKPHKKQRTHAKKHKPKRK